MHGHKQRIWSQYFITIISKLRLNESARIPFVTPTQNSPNPQIALWDRYRLENRQHKPPKTRPLWMAADFIAALQSAIGSGECMAQLKRSLSSQSISATNEFPSPRGISNTLSDSVSHFGSMNAPVGFILDFAVASQLDVMAGKHWNFTDQVIPWALERSGFDAESALVWAFNFRTGGVVDLRYSGDLISTDDHLISLNRSILRESAIKIVLLCGLRA